MPPKPQEKESDPLAFDPNVQNVQALAELHARAEQEVSHHQRRIEALTTGLGRPITLYIMLAVVATWMAMNVIAPFVRLHSVDPPPFFWLQGAVGLAALLMTTTVLITQLRQAKMAARRTLLDLHVNLLSEQKVAKLIALIEELRRDLPSVSNRHDPEAEVMAIPVDPQAVIATLEEQIEQAIAGQPGPADQAAVVAGLAAQVQEVVREAAPEPDEEEGR